MLKIIILRRNYSKITNNNWHINVKASQTKVNLGVQDMAV